MSQSQLINYYQMRPAPQNKPDLRATIVVVIMVVLLAASIATLIIQQSF